MDIKKVRSIYKFIYFIKHSYGVVSVGVSMNYELIPRIRKNPVFFLLIPALAAFFIALVPTLKYQWPLSWDIFYHVHIVLRTWIDYLGSSHLFTLWANNRIPASFSFSHSFFIHNI